MFERKLSQWLIFQREPPELELKISVELELMLTNAARAIRRLGKAVYMRLKFK